MFNHSWPGGKPPRWYAYRIIRLQPELRDEALSRVPGFIRDWVKFYVDDYYLKQKYLKKYHYWARRYQGHLNRVSGKRFRKQYNAAHQNLAGRPVEFDDNCPF